MKPVFYASEVAALIGKHPYKSVDEALFRVISATPKWKPLIADIKRNTGTRTEKEVVEKADATIKAAIERAVTTAISSNEKDIQTTIVNFQKEATVKILNEALIGKEAPPEFVNAAGRIQSKASTIDQEAVALESSRTVKVLAQEIQKQRGTKMEAPTEDRFGVTSRGDPVRYECDEYTIVGYIDGMHNDRVVETKNRKRFWKTPPPYDIIQLRCYMKMKGADGILLECFPGHPDRHTRVDRDDGEWETIHDNLVYVSEQLERMDAYEAARIARVGLV